MHRTPLLVYIYEGILLDIFDYDFSPSSEFAGRDAINLNVSSEGVDDLSDLQAMGQGLTLVHFSAQLELTLPLSARLEPTLAPA